MLVTITVLKIIYCSGKSAPALLSTSKLTIWLGIYSQSNGACNVVRHPRNAFSVDKYCVYMIEALVHTQSLALALSHTHSFSLHLNVCLILTQRVYFIYGYI